MTSRRAITLAALCAAATTVGVYALRRYFARRCTAEQPTPAKAPRAAGTARFPGAAVLDQLLAADLPDFDTGAAEPARAATLGAVKGGTGKTTTAHMLADLYNNGMPIGIDRAAGELVTFNPLSGDRNRSERPVREDVIDVEFDEVPPPLDELIAAPRAKSGPPDLPEYRTAAAGLPRTIIVPVWLNLEQMLDRDVVAFIELIYLARDPEHVLFGGTGTAEILERYGFYSQTLGIQTTCKKVILASVSGTGADLALRPVGEVLANS